MNILIIAEKRTQIKPYLDALTERGQSPKYIRVSKITLVSKQNETLIKSLGEEVEAYDAVFIQTRTSLAPFIEPLLEELEAINSYTSIKKGSYFTGWNEPYQFVTLALANVPTPKTITTASVKNIEQLSKKISYPILINTYIGKKNQQTLVINSNRELNGFVKSIKTEIDGFMIREFIEGNVISSIIVGKKTFSIKRNYNGEEVEPIKSGKYYTMTENENETAIKAAAACGYDIARVDTIRGKVIKVTPMFSIEDFNNICSVKIEDYVAEFLIEMAKKHENKVLAPYDFLGLKKLLGKTILKGLLK
jgi:glutathione synthase/RimK-type ligase-like ATP-grasp enzyme